MNTGELNKIAGGVLGALLAFLLIGFVSSQLYGTRGGGHHGEEDPVLAFAVEVEDEGGGGSGGASGPDWGALLSSVDAGAGESVFNKCKSCHAFGSNGVGPDLEGVVGREIASVSGYSYSDALSGKDGSWDLENLHGFLKNPKSWASGTKMGFAGISNDQDNVNLIAWLNEQSSSPIELTAPEGSGGGGESGDGESASSEGEGSEGDGGGDGGGGGGGAMFAEADPDAGSKVFNKCKACHAFGKNGVGPDLHGVVGRKIAGVDGYSYSDALSGKDGSWDPQTLSDFLEDPKGWATGTKMSYAGLKDEGDRVNVIAYLNQQSDSPIDLGAAGGGGDSGGGNEATSEGGDEAAEGGEGSSEGGEEAAKEESADSEGGDDAAKEEEAKEEETEGGNNAAKEEEAAAEGDDAAAEGEGSDGDGEQMAAASGEGSGDAAGGGDAAAGKKVFRKCRACHAFGKNGVGPDLSGVVGRKIAGLDGYSYSDALSGKEGSWDAETLHAFLEDPKGWAQGTKMSYAGLKEEEDRANVIAYLKEQGGN